MPDEHTQQRQSELAALLERAYRPAYTLVQWPLRPESPDNAELLEKLVATFDALLLAIARAYGPFTKEPRYAELNEAELREGVARAIVGAKHRGEPTNVLYAASVAGAQVRQRAYSERNAFIEEWIGRLVARQRRVVLERAAADDFPHFVLRTLDPWTMQPTLRGLVIERGAEAWDRAIYGNLGLTDLEAISEQLLEGEAHAAPMEISPVAASTSTFDEPVAPTTGRRKGPGRRRRADDLPPRIERGDALEKFKHDHRELSWEDIYQDHDRWNAGPRTLERERGIARRVHEYEAEIGKSFGELTAAQRHQLTEIIASEFPS